MKRNVWETQTMDQVITLPLDKMMRSNIHMQGDTILIEFYLAQYANPSSIQTAQYVGQFRLRWKHCMEEENKNKRNSEEIQLTDQEFQPKAGKVGVAVRYYEAGHPESRFNADGSKKPKNRQR